MAATSTTQRWRHRRKTQSIRRWMQRRGRSSSQGTLAPEIVRTSRRSPWRAHRRCWGSSNPGRCQNSAQTILRGMESLVPDLRSTSQGQAPSQYGKYQRVGVQTNGGVLLATGTGARFPRSLSASWTRQALPDLSAALRECRQACRVGEPGPSAGCHGWRSEALRSWLGTKSTQRSQLGHEALQPSPRYRSNGQIDRYRSTGGCKWTLMTFGCPHSDLNLDMKPCHLVHLSWAAPSMSLSVAVDERERLLSLSSCRKHDVQFSQ